MAYDFNNLIILDLANNHQGDLAHAVKIIKEMGRVVSKYNLKGALKFQFRQLDTFIHPDYMDREDLPHIPRFVSTRLPMDDYKTLIEVAKESDLIPTCTPFDEESVDIIEQLGIEIIKLASCSVTDLPLVKRLAQAGLPTVASTGGATLSQIDKIVRIFQEHDLDFALHHCVSIYPTPDEQMELNQIDIFSQRYQGVPIGWSTHEDPNDCSIVQMAYAKGAVLFERHVGIETSDYKLNKYSSTPDQVDKWLASLKKAMSVMGSVHRAPPSLDEIDSLNSLKRGVYLKKPTEKGDSINREDVYFAMPLLEGGLEAGHWHEELISNKSYLKDGFLEKGVLADAAKGQGAIIDEIMLQVHGMLNDARIVVGEGSEIEISHHYGLDRFREFGAVIIDVINREYCKKLIVQLPRQKHPYHLHKRKEETFQILYGDLEVEKNGEPHELKIGDLFLVEPGEWHKFSTMHGVIFEEVSTTHFNDDSYYQDESIAKMDRAQRKTKVTDWKLS